MHLICSFFFHTKITRQLHVYIFVCGSTTQVGFSFGSGREKYQIEITNRFVALENLSDDEDVDRTWENFKENIKTSAKESLGLHELKQNKLWFDEECLGFLDRRKRAKMQWIQDPNQNKVDNLNNVRREVSRHFREKRHI